MSRYPKIELDGAVVAVTGAARGIGLATAKAFVAEGARVAMGDLDEELVKEAAAELGRAASGHRLDVTDPESFAEFLAAAEQVHGGPIDVLDNNAGVMPNGAFLDQTEIMDRLTMDVNVLGVVNGMRAVLPGLLERRRGHVVNVASLAGKFPIKGLAVYNASKFAVVGLTAATRLEYDATGVSISAVLPSIVRTELSSGIDYSGMPAVEPEAIAAAVIRSVRTREGEIAVPGYVGKALLASTLLPEPVMRGIRGVMKDDRAITAVDADERRAYLDRIENQK